MDIATTAVAAVIWYFWTTGEELFCVDFRLAQALIGNTVCQSEIYQCNFPMFFFTIETFFKYTCFFETSKELF